jgi:type IV pilus assembly protein PilO
MNRTRRILLSSILVPLIIVLFYNFSISPRKKRIVDLTEQHKNVASVLETSRSYIEKYRSVKAAYDSISVIWDKLEELLPEEKEMPELLASISNAGKKSGAEFALFKPLPQLPHDFYEENPVQIKVTCTYHQLGSFLSRIAALPRLVNVDKLKLEGLKEGKPTMNAEFVGIAYVTRKAPPPAETTAK